MTEQIESVEVILKLSERCNLACPDCYFFFGGNEDYKDNPALVSRETIQSLGKYLAEAIGDFSIKKIRIDYHGGEPLLIGVPKFDETCRSLAGALSNKCDLSFAIQTNAVLIDEKWIDVFAKHRVTVGISFDGPAEVNDRSRPDKKGRGSYERAKRGLELVKKAAQEGKLPHPGLLCVINPRHDARQIYRHFVDELKFSYMDFLLPDLTHDSFSEESSQAYGNYLCDLYDEWASRDATSVGVRFIARAVYSLTSGSRGAEWRKATEAGHLAITVSSSGHVGPNDILKVTKRPFFRNFHCANSSLRQFLESKGIIELRRAASVIPETCKDCCWRSACRGGEVYHRFSSSAGFERRSVYCDAYKELYSYVAAHLIGSKSVSEEKVLESLQIAE